MTKIHRTFALLLLAALAIGAATAAAPASPKERPSKTLPKEPPSKTAPKQPPPKRWKSIRDAHLRSGPSSQSSVIASVPKDTVLTSFEPCAKRWCAVEYKGFRGWIYEVFLIDEPGKAAAPAVAPLAKAKLSKPPTVSRGPVKEAGVSKAAVKEPVVSKAPLKEAARTSYRAVVGLGAEESLPIRKEPLDTARMIGTLLPGAKNIAGLETCMGQWCLIEHDGVRGYVRSRFLARLEAAPAPKYGVEGEENLNVLSFASPGADVVGEIPFYAAGIVPVGDCNGEWCHVRYLGLVGFVDARRLRAEPSSGG